MGRQTKTFRQTRSSGTSDTSYKNFAKVNQGAWHTKLLNILKVRGKGETKYG